MSLDGPWSFINARQQAKFEIGIAPMPAGASGSKTWSDGSGFGISKEVRTRRGVQGHQCHGWSGGGDIPRDAGRAYPALISTQNSWYEGNKTQDVKPVMDASLESALPYATT